MHSHPDYNWHHDHALPALFKNMASQLAKAGFIEHAARTRRDFCSHQLCSRNTRGLPVLSLPKAPCSSQSSKFVIENQLKVLKQMQKNKRKATYFGFDGLLSFLDPATISLACRRHSWLTNCVPGCPSARHQGQPPNASGWCPCAFAW